MTATELAEQSKRIADDNLALAAADVTVIVVLANEQGYSFAVRGDRDLAVFALTEAVGDAADDEGWHGMNVGSA
jgi:hypothetical protein